MRSWQATWIPLLACIVFSETAIGRQVDESLGEGLINWGQCRLDNNKRTNDWDSDLDERFPAICIQPKASVQVYTRDDASTANNSLVLGSIYHGSHINKHLSVHGTHNIERLSNVGDQSFAPHQRNELIKETETFFLQIGNPAWDQVRVSVGKLKPAFGIHARVVPELLQVNHHSTKYWDSQRYGLRIALDSQVSASHEISLLSNHPKTTDGTTDMALSIRSLFDIAAMDGFRFVTSLHAEGKLERRVSAGFINMSARGDQMTFEWARLLYEPRISSDYEQNFHFYYLTAFKANHRWVFDFDSERSIARVWTVGTDFRLPDYGLFRAALTYNHGWFGWSPSYFVITSGVQFAL